MGVLNIFKTLQKARQKDMTSVMDVHVSRSTAMRSLDLMKDSPFPGGCEEQFITNVDKENNTGQPEAARRVQNSLVTFRGDVAAVRTEIIMSASEYLSELLNDELETIVRDVQSIVQTPEQRRL